MIVSEANRVGEDWRLDATVLNADGSAQLVSARAGDPIAAASSLARSLRELLAPEGTGDAGETMAPDVLALAAHMKAAILEAQNGRALALLAQCAEERSPQAPEIVLLQAEALTQLGKPGEAIDALRPLVDAQPCIAPPPRWLPDAWSALGDSELARGNPAQAEAYFRRAIQLDGVADRRSLGLAWRGSASRRSCATISMARSKVTCARGSSSSRSAIACCSRASPTGSATSRRRAAAWPTH